MRKYRKYVFAVVFLRRKDPQFLILHRIKNWRGWELPKGGVMSGEKELDGLRREIREEVGSRKFKILAKTRKRIEYKFPKAYVKDGIVFHGASGYAFVVEFSGNSVKVDRREHDKYAWVSKEKALKMLMHKNHKDTLLYVCQRYSMS